MRTALFGASGFVGTAVRRAIAERGHSATIFARDRAVGDVEWHAPADLDSTAIAQLAACDSICYLAAYIPRHYANSAEAAACLDVNALGALRVLDAARAAGIGYFLYASTAALYRFSAARSTEDDSVYPDRRATYYLASKLAGELYVRHAEQTSSLRTGVVRIASVYGARMTRDGAVSHVAHELAAGRAITLSDAGSFQSDLVHVDDVASAIVGCLERELGGITNIGSGITVTMHDVAMILADEIGADPSLIRVEGTARTDHGTSLVDIARARRELNFSPRSFRDGARDVSTASRRDQSSGMP